MRRLVTLVGAPALIAGSLALASADNFAADPLEPVSGPASPFATCTADNVAQQPGTNFPNSTVEPWVDVNPTNTQNIVATWQQDRWSNGGSRGLVAGVSTDGGSSWTSVVIPRITACSGNTDFLRASDPWLSFAPNGDLYHVSLSITVRPDGLTAPSALLVSKSTTGGATWSNPITVVRDDRATVLNDKESITADPENANLVYLVWDRLESPRPRLPMSPSSMRSASEGRRGSPGPRMAARAGSPRARSSTRARSTRPSATRSSCFRMAI